MNKFFYFSFIFCMFSCEFLDETPEDFLSPANFYTSKADAIAAVNSVYDQLSYYGSLWQLGERPSDNIQDGPVGRDVSLELHTFTWNSATSIFGTVWQGIYRSINRSNTVLEEIPNVEMDEELKRRLLAEVRFLRALNYFDLIRNFGDVPLMVNSTASFDDLFVERNAVAEVVDVIIEDLKVAEIELPLEYSGSDIGRATKGAAKALYARLLLHIGNYDAAAVKAKEVIDLGEYELFSSVGDLWNVANQNGIEHIFSVQYLAGVQGSGFSNAFAVRGGEAPITGGSTAIVRQEFLDAFEPGDERRLVSVLEEYTYPDGTPADLEPHIWKFFDETATDPTDGNTNWPVLRYAEVLLIYAEALNESQNGPSSEAYEAINSVRIRAGLDAVTDGLSQAEFRERLFMERRMELCFEGHRFYDLKRSGNLESRMQELGLNVEEKHSLFPIPLREMDANPNLRQNSGY